MKKMALLIALFFLALQVYVLNASESGRSEEVVVTTTLESGPDISMFRIKNIR